MKHKYRYELYFDRIWKLHVVAYDILDVIKTPRRLHQAFKIAKMKKTYYPELKRKNFVERLKDNIIWVLKNKEANFYYYSYGLDIKNFRNTADFLPFREFKLQREGAHYLYPNKYRFSSQILLRDKYIFNCYLAEALGKKYVPGLVGIIQNGTITLHENKQEVALEDYFKEDRRFFCKLLDGECADSAFLLTSSNGVIKNGKETVTVDSLLKAFGTAKMLCQDIVEQHEEVNAINPYCVNTIRIITIRGNSGKIHVFAASLRIGTSSESFVDNRAVGGAAVGIDQKGRLKKYGFQHQQFGGRIEQHPVTGLVFEGYQLPYWKEVVDLVTKAHKAIIGVQSIGWDVAITPDGPILIEGNDNWEVQNPQDSHGGLKTRWYQLINDDNRR